MCVIYHPYSKKTNTTQIVKNYKKLFQKPIRNILLKYIIATILALFLLYLYYNKNDKLQIITIILLTIGSFRVNTVLRTTHNKK